MSMNPKGKTPRRARPSIKKDPVSVRDYLRYPTLSSCEECTHFKHSDQTCTIGYVTTPHRQKKQLEDYLLGGKIAICRFMEID